MIWNNNFLEYDQVGFQKMVYVAVLIILFRFTKWRIFWVTHLRCTINTPMATPTETIPVASISHRRKLFNRWMRISVVARHMGLFSKTKMVRLFPRTLNDEFSAINIWLQVARKELISAGLLWPCSTPWAGTTWPSTTLSLQFGAKIEGAISIILTTVCSLSSAVAQALTVTGM